MCPLGEMVISVYTNGFIDKSGTGLIEADTKFMHSKGLLVAKALVRPTTGTVPVCIANPYSQSCKLYNNTMVASFEPIEPVQLLSMKNTQSEESAPSTCSNNAIERTVHKKLSKSFF
ncbi:MAG: hypothetical protein AB2693_30960 [Candidatus Thiodiazotropha sp.]